MAAKRRAEQRDDEAAAVRRRLACPNAAVHAGPSMLLLRRTPCSRVVDKAWPRSLLAPLAKPSASNSPGALEWVRVAPVTPVLVPHSAARRAGPHATPARA
jgi:hypothetical protein